MIGARDLAFPENQSAELVPFHDRRPDHVDGAAVRRHRYGLDLLTRRSRPNTPADMSCWRYREFSIAGFSSILTGLNFIVSVHALRAPGMYWSRLPLFIWSMYATSIILVLGDARACDHAVSAGGRAARAHRYFRSQHGRAILCCFRISSGFIVTRPSTS